MSLKKLAAAAGAKDAAMLPPAEAERLTGYHVGGISPFGQKKRVRVFVEQTALAYRDASSSMAAGADCRSNWRPPTSCACWMRRRRSC